MSFEGYYQVLCKNGHYSTCDCYTLHTPGSSDDWRCSICGEECAWWNIVDETNGSYCISFPGYCDSCTDKDYCDDEGRIDGYIELEEKTPAKTQKCNLGHVVFSELETS